MNPYSTLPGSTDQTRDLGLLLAAAELIDSYCGQPLYRRYATLRFDLYDGQGTLPSPLHTVGEVRINGDVAGASEYGVSGAVFQLSGRRRANPRAATRHLAEVDGVVGWGTLVALTDYTAVSSTLTAAEGEPTLPLGTILYNSGSPVHVTGVAGQVMQLSGAVADASSIQRVVVPSVLVQASKALVGSLSLLASSSSAGGDASPELDDLLTVEVRQLLAPCRAGGGVSTYSVGTGTPGFPQAGGGFGPGFGRGFD